MIFKSLFILSLLLSNLYALDEKLKFGLLYEKIFSSKKEADIGVKLWVKQSHIKEFTDNMEIVFYKKGSKILDDFISGKVSVILVNPTFYFENKKALDSLNPDKWNMSRTEDKFEQLYLITNNATKNDFHEKNIKKIYYKLDLAKVWLESISVNNNLKDFAFDDKAQKLEKSKKLIFNQFFGKNSYSVVSKDLYDSMVSLNPQIKSKIKIVKKSKPIFFRGLGFTRKDLNKKFHEMVINTIYKVNTTKTDFRRSSFFDAQTIYILNDSDLEELNEMHNDYFSLRR